MEVACWISVRFQAFLPVPVVNQCDIFASLKCRDASATVCLDTLNSIQM